MESQGLLWFGLYINAQNTSVAALRSLKQFLLSKILEGFLQQDPFSIGTFTPFPDLKFSAVSVVLYLQTHYIKLNTKILYNAACKAAAFHVYQHQ